MLQIFTEKVPFRPQKVKGNGVKVPDVECVEKVVFDVNDSKDNTPNRERDFDHNIQLGKDDDSEAERSFDTYA